MVRFWFDPVPIFPNRNLAKPGDLGTVTEPSQAQPVQDHNILSKRKNITNFLILN